MISTMNKLGARLPKPVKSALLQLRARIFDIHAARSYSQEGEDMILRRLFEGQREGFYVDVGAHHPKRFSNTYFFYRLGWHGINIEPNPEAIQSFRFSRPRDINLQLGVSDQAGMLTYFRFDEPALNTFDGELVESRRATSAYRLLGTTDVPVERLEQILSRHLPPNRTIDFLSIDVEGLDLAVLRSNNWHRFRPKCVLVEALGASLEAINRSAVRQFMNDQRYILLAKTVNTLIFVDSNSQFLGRLYDCVQ